MTGRTAPDPLVHTEDRWIETADHALIHVRVQRPVDSHIDRDGVGGLPALILLHGWSQSGAAFDRQEPLARRCLLVRPDLRGHGRSSKPLHGHSLPDYARDVARVADALGIERFVLGGWSLGGPLALECWRQYGPERILGLALIEATPCPSSTEPWNTHALRGDHPDALAKALARMERDRTAHLEVFTRAMFPLEGVTERQCARFLEQSLLTPAWIAAAIYADYGLRDYTPLLPDIRVPVLAAYGSGAGSSLGPRPAEYLASVLPDCAVALFDKGGHAPFFMQPEAFNRALGELLDRCFRA